MSIFDILIVFIIFYLIRIQLFQDDPEPDVVGTPLFDPPVDSHSGQTTSSSSLNMHLSVAAPDSHSGQITSSSLNMHLSPIQQPNTPFCLRQQSPDALQQPLHVRQHPLLESLRQPSEESLQHTVHSSKEPPHSIQQPADENLRQPPLGLDLGSYDFLQRDSVPSQVNHILVYRFYPGIFR